MKKFGYIFITVLLSFTSVNCYAESGVLPREGNSNCYDFEVVFARGSGGEYENTREYYELKAASETIFSTYGYTANFSDLDYPATDLSSPLKLLGAFVSAGRGYEFGRSVRQGVNGLRLHYRNIDRQCPNTKWILIGYSQGAMVMADAVKTFRAESVAHVLMFGDPGTYLPEGAGLFPDACRRYNYSPWRRYAPECRTYQGVFGARIPYEADGLKSKYSLWCDSDDYICGSSRNPFRNSGHTRYAEYMYKDFRRLTAQIINDYEDTLVLSSVRLATAARQDHVIIEQRDNSIRVSWDPAAINEKYLLLRLNGVDLGYMETLASEIEIRDIDWNEENNVTVLPMAEDGELREEVAIEVFDERSVPPEEENVLPEAKPEVSTDSSLPEPETSKIEESVSTEEDNLSPSGSEKESNGDAPKSSSKETDPVVEQKQDILPINSLAKINTKRGFGLARGSDIAKIVLAMLAAASILVVFLIRKK